MHSLPDEAGHKFQYEFQGGFHCVGDLQDRVVGPGTGQNVAGQTGGLLPQCGSVQSELHRPEDDPQLPAVWPSKYG